MQNYFEHFNISIALHININDLRNLYYQKSRESHPDFHQNEIEKEFQSAFNNQAYKTLLDPLSRLKYILEIIEGPIHDQDFKLPQEFLMQMLTLHESIFEAKASDNQVLLETLLNELLQLENQSKDRIDPVMINFDAGDRSSQTMEQLRFYYFELKYFRRLHENIDGQDAAL